MELSDAAWSESADANNLQPPSGFKSGVDAGDVKLTFREIMAAVKRDWNWSHPVNQFQDSATLWQLDPSTAIAAYLDGGTVYGMKMLSVGASLSLSPELSISGKAYKKVYALDRDGPFRPTKYAFAVNNQPMFFYYDSTLDSGSGGFVLISQPYNEPLIEDIVCPITSEAGAVAAGTGKFTFRMPYNFVVTIISASLNAAQTSGSILTIDVNNSGTSVFSTRLTVDNGEKTSVTAATPAVMTSTTGVSCASDNEITIDVDQIGDGTAAGLKITLRGYQG